jgi:hypothetical protein
MTGSPNLTGRAYLGPSLRCCLKTTNIKHIDRLAITEGYLAGMDYARAIQKCHGWATNKRNGKGRSFEL